MALMSTTLARIAARTRRPATCGDGSADRSQMGTTADRRTRADIPGAPRNGVRRIWRSTRLCYRKVVGRNGPFAGAARAPRPPSHRSDRDSDDEQTAAGDQGDGEDVAERRIERVQRDTGSGATRTPAMKTARPPGPRRRRTMRP